MFIIDYTDLCIAQHFVKSSSEHAISYQMFE